MFDSRVIVEYLDTLTPVVQADAGATAATAPTSRCWEALADGVLDAAVLVRLEKTLRPAEQQSAAWIERQMGKVHAGLAAMSADLGETPFCARQPVTRWPMSPSAARWAGWPSASPRSTWRDDYPNLARLFDKLSERPSFKDTVPH